ncbi:Zn-dependent peptidase ImmA, M78 family [Ruminococcus sp. YRD2003]|uniref:ImmA/IrrE family metallo-endopeptidase n=1 Tax=Ruminococcus sp. YRD2003 TaxID=1452313 RepID=UPI0008AD7C96|nr:Zn-dependent peptidase ImmA, M78 family [Ruminococcus flavefaciens]
MQTKIEVSTRILDWIIRSIPLESIPDKVLSSIQKWRSGDSQPTFNQLEKVSKALGIPFGYFFLQTPPNEDLSIVEYRTIDSIALEKPSRNLIDTLHDMEQIQDWTYNYLLSIESDKLKFVGALKNQTNSIEIAKYIRQLLGIQDDWFKSAKTADESFSLLRNAMSNAGVIVMMSGIVENNTHRSLQIDEFRAFALVNEYAPLIFINSNDSINGKVFSLIHEFVHICIGENSLFNDRYSTGQKVDKTEVICNAVAAEILVPIDQFTKEWFSESDDVDETMRISSLAKEFKCGDTVIARRALDKKLITHEQYEFISKEAVKRYKEYMQRKKERKEGGGDFYRTVASRIDKRFLRMLLSSVQEGTTMYTDAFRLTNTNRSTFTSLAEKVGGAI